MAKSGQDNYSNIVFNMEGVTVYSPNESVQSITLQRTVK